MSEYKFNSDEHARDELAKVFHKYQISKDDSELILQVCQFVVRTQISKGLNDSKIFEEFADALRGIISLIENGQHDLAIDHLGKRIKELEGD